MLNLLGNRTLFQLALDRLEGVFSPEKIIVVTVADQAASLQVEYPQIPLENYLIEPCGRGTASVVGLAAIELKKRDPEAVMVVLTADHFIENVLEFQNIIKTAFLVAEQGFLVTIGIEPIYPATGYGYIQRGDPLGDFGGYTAYHVIRFKEKPDEETARQMVVQGDHDWNSGMFCWRVERILAEIDRQMPDLSHVLEQIDHAWGTPEKEQLLQTIWPGLKSEMVDYGIMENAARVAVLPGFSLGWNDVGSWEAIFDVVKADENGNILLGAKHIGLDTGSSLVVSDSHERLIATIGVNDMIIVDTKDAVLICPRNDSQRVRQLVNLLKQNGYQIYL